jgi:hypothetical protein
MRQHATQKGIIIVLEGAILNGERAYETNDAGGKATQIAHDKVHVGVERKTVLFLNPGSLTLWQAPCHLKGNHCIYLVHIEAQDRSIVQLMEFRSMLIVEVRQTN